MQICLSFSGRIFEYLFMNFFQTKIEPFDKKNTNAYSSIASNTQRQYETLK